MGYDLEPLNKEEDFLHYNMMGWYWLGNFLSRHGADCSNIPSYNDKEDISEEKCKDIADCIEKNLHTLKKEDQEWIQPHIKMWRNSGGYRVW